jgi:hypothetical protein
MAIGFSPSAAKVIAQFRTSSRLPWFRRRARLKPRPGRLLPRPGHRGRPASPPSVSTSATRPRASFEPAVGDGAVGAPFGQLLCAPRNVVAHGARSDERPAVGSVQVLPGTPWAVSQLTT